VGWKQITAAWNREIAVIARDRRNRRDRKKLEGFFFGPVLA
jgi:hypothetical protein